MTCGIFTQCSVTHPYKGLGYYSPDKGQIPKALSEKKPHAKEYILCNSTYMGVLNQAKLIHDRKPPQQWLPLGVAVETDGKR